MGRRFLGGAATALLLLALGLSLEARMPDRNGPGEETVSFYGLAVYRQPIPPGGAGRHSPAAAVLVAVGCVLGGAAAAGAAAVVLGRAVERGAPAGGEPL